MAEDKSVKEKIDILEELELNVSLLFLTIIQLVMIYNFYMKLQEQDDTNENVYKQLLIYYIIDDQP